MNAWQKGFAGTLVVLAIAWQYGFNWDERITDAHENWRVALSSDPFPPQIVVIAVDDLSLARLKSSAGQISRHRYAELLDRLGQARVVGIDVVLDEPDPHDPTGDRALAAAVKRQGRVVLPLFAWQGARPLDRGAIKDAEALTRSLPPGAPDFADALATINPHSLQLPFAPLARNAALVGYADINAEYDNIYRRPNSVRQTIDTGRLMPHFSVAVASLATKTPLQEAMRNLPDALCLGSRTVPLAQQGSLYLRPIARRGGDYQRKPGARVPTISFYDALHARPETFRDKIVLIGVTAAATGDIRATPIDNGLRGVELNAEILANLLYTSPNRPMGLLMRWAVILLAVSLPLYLYSTQPPPRATAAASLAFIALVLVMEASYWTLQEVPSWSSVLLGFGAATLITGLQRLREEAALRQALRHRFASYVAPEMVERLVRDPAAHAGQSARRVRAAVLFSDVRDFTAYSEQNPPEAVRHQMEDYLGEMTKAVHMQRGVVDKFIGDGIMALFGPFYEEEGHEAAKGLACALDMLERLDLLNARWRQEGLPSFRIGIGLQVGNVLFGEFGSPDRYTLTAFGNEVNLASRLESATKEFKATILTTDTVHRETEEVLGHLVRFEDKGQHTLRGRAQPTHIFSVSFASEDPAQKEEVRGER